jgi:AcrR family transcriptional regulator
MPRPRKTDLNALCEAAYAAFLAAGYRNAQVSDVAARLGLSVGAIYRHVDSKEALFELALRWAFDLPIPSGPPPLSAVPFADLTALIRDRLAEEVNWSFLESRLDAPPPDDVGAELQTAIERMFRITHRRRYGIKILDRCFAEIPALRDTHIDLVKGRTAELLTRYVALRAGQGRLRAPGGAAMTARALMEMVVWMAMHRTFDPLAPQPEPGTDAEEAALAAALGVALDGLVVRRE